MGGVGLGITNPVITIDLAMSVELDLQTIGMASCLVKELTTAATATELRKLIPLHQRVVITQMAGPAGAITDQISAPQCT